MGPRGNTNRNDHLRFLGIIRRTRRSYENAAAAFIQYFRALRGRLPNTMVELDEELAEYVNHLYQEGDSVSLAGWTLSGLKRFYPRCRPTFSLHSSTCVTGKGFTCPKGPTHDVVGARAMPAAAFRVGRPTSH